MELRLFWCLFRRGVICSRGEGPFGGVGIESLLRLLSLDRELLARWAATVAVVVSIPRPMPPYFPSLAAVPFASVVPLVVVPLTCVGGWEGGYEGAEAEAAEGPLET